MRHGCRCRRYVACRGDFSGAIYGAPQAPKCAHRNCDIAVELFPLHSLNLFNSITALSFLRYTSGTAKWHHQTIAVSMLVNQNNGRPH